MSLVVSIDVEDWPQSTWDRTLPVTDRAAHNTERVLDLLAAQNKKITFFVLGKFAERFPAVVVRMAHEGHEIASHGHGHVEVFQLSEQEFRADISRAKQYLEDLLGQPVTGYRAPDFSITARSLWALDVLAELGFEYDSSIFPIVHSRYGIPTWPAQPVRVKLSSGRTIVELPIATSFFLGHRWPVAGGGYHRLLPWPIIRWVINDGLRHGQTFVSYCHPYEFDPEEMNALPIAVPLKTKMHQGLGRKGFQSKFEKLLRRFEVCCARHVALDFQWPDFACRGDGAC